MFCLLTMFCVLKMLKRQLFLLMLNVNYDCSILFSNLMADDLIICNEYMRVWIVLGFGVKCCNFSAAITNFDTCCSRWHKHMVMGMKIALFTDMKMCNLLEVHWCFIGSTLMKEVADSSETIVHFYQTTWHHIPISQSLPWEHQISDDDEKYSDT
jgi:hypothetical protein